MDLIVYFVRYNFLYNVTIEFISRCEIFALPCISYDHDRFDSSSSALTVYMDKSLTTWLSAFYKNIL